MRAAVSVRSAQEVIADEEFLLKRMIAMFGLQPFALTHFRSESMLNLREGPGGSQSLGIDMWNGTK
jgi:hypothetical protein